MANKNEQKNKEDAKTLGELRNFKTRSLPKNQPGFFGKHETFLHENLDKNCLYEFSDSFVRIEYPGDVKNIDRAIDTLGGMHNIHMAVEGKKLELFFNPQNHYNTGCVADKDANMGLLIKIKQHSSSQEYSYEILGLSGCNFKFNRMCDFQYLPLVAKNEPENEESEVEYVYDKIITSKIPSLKWFTKKDIPSFLIASNFARYDTPQGKFQVNSANTLISLLRPDIKLQDQSFKKEKQSHTVSSIRVSFLKPLTNIPDQPLSSAMELIKVKALQKHYGLVRNLFQERPIWRKAAIMHKTNISAEAAKYVLPCFAYYSHSGPWRSCWIKFGYDPSSDYNSRVFQVLDFRIRSNEGMQLKIKAKRGILSSIFKNKDFVFRAVCEEDYALRPNQLPPARQMFYQYCDIFLSEIQEMVSKLPKLPPGVKFDPKNGWLPLSFQEHCREIVNKHIFDAVQQQVLKESQEQEKNTDNISNYCSKMLSNIRKGVHQSIGEYSGGNTTNQENIIDDICLSDDNEELEQIDASEVVYNLPERIPGNFEDDDEESDLEIDLEAVEEVNKIVSGIKDQNLSL